MPWQDDFFEIDLNLVKTPELDPKWAISHGYTREQMASWINDLHHVQRLIYQNQYNPENFDNMRSSPNLSEQQLAKSYHYFYNRDTAGHRTNHDYIAVDWRGDHYEVTNGNHRVWLAQKAGLRHLPARVFAPTREVLEKLRQDADRLIERPLWEARTEAPKRPDRMNRERG